MIKNYKIYILIFVFLFLACIGFFYFYRKSENFFNIDSDSTLKEKSEEDSEKDDELLEKITLPVEYDLQVPFVAQAPFGIWDDLHNNACEEAALLQLHYYKLGVNLTREKADAEIKAMVDFEVKKYGRHKDLTIKEVANLALEFYGYQNSRIIQDFSWEELKKEIVAGNPVIIPLAGRALENPYFRSPGPIYHMLVVRGYTSTELITNDVGTKRGRGYRYRYEILDRAIHDWTGDPATITSGRRVMLVIKN